jgi:intraflagellar transport protein 172
MKLKHHQSLTSPSEGASVKVTALCWSPNGKKLAVCTSDRIVLMYDDEGNRRDKFSTKPVEKGPKNYVVRDMVFSPTNDKLAIAQSDNMVFVYKTGIEWGEKKSICNKFQHSSSITCLVWPSKRASDLVYGLAEGKVKIGQMRTHKFVTLYKTESYVTAMCTNPSGNAVVSAHLDGSIYTFWFDSAERGAHIIARHPCVPFALTWGQSIVVAGNDSQVTFYDEDGGEENTFDHSDQKDCREFTSAACNPTGDAVVLGNFNSFYVYTRNKDSMGWEEKGITTVDNMYSVTKLAWKSDGDKLAVGTVCGVVDTYDVCVKRAMYKGGFELTYVSHSQVIVKHVESNMRIVVRSQYGLEIMKTNIYKNRYVVATTSETLLIGDIETLKMSEVQWHGNGSEKFIFDNPSAAIIYYAGEVSLVEYGVNEILSSIRTSFTNSHVLSVRINERQVRSQDLESHPDGNKKVAFLLDAQTVCVKDLINQSSITVNHDSKVDWIELNGRASLLLFRDKRRHLHLYDCYTQRRTQLLNFCTYVQWVPNSDVVVAQNRNSLCVWYNIHAPDQITTHNIKGDVEDIERTEGRTEVIVDEGMSQAVYPLDESLISFGAAMDDESYERAVDILDNLEVTPEVEAMWKKLSSCALRSSDLRIAQRCAAALGDVAMSRFLGEVKDIKTKAEIDMGSDRGSEHYLVRAKLALLQKDLQSAENELINQGQIDECIDMYQKLFKHEEAIRVAEQGRHPDAVEMRQSHFQYLLDSNQDEQAAAFKEHEGDYVEAINLYMKGGMPGKAAQVIIRNDITQPLQLLDTVANNLSRAGMHAGAGDFYERLDDLPRALDSYIRGHAYRKATELARRSFPGRVVELQEQWGDYLVSQKQIDMAINHYIEAKVYQKAIEAALNARQYSRALQLVDVVDSTISRQYYKQLATYYEDARQWELAERCYVSADQPQLAVEMHTKQGHWEVAHKLAMSYMSEGEVGLLYITQAQRLESQGKFREAEKLYLTVSEKDLAINMYKKHRLFDDMIRLVQDLRPDLLKETHQFLAQTLEIEGSLKDAERHYIEAVEWHSAVNMYRANEMWDDAFRVAKFYGGINACKRVTIALLMAVGVIEGSKMLTKHGLIEAAIEHATENGAFDMAFELTNHSMPKKLQDVHLKHALFLEDDERFKEAEEAFVAANKPKEAIDMYVHQQDWVSALRVAENYDPATVADVLIAQARAAADSGDYSKAEELYLTAARPELALVMYQENDMWTEALNLAQLHLPHRAAEVNMAYQQAQARAGKGSNKQDFMSAGRQLEQSQQWSQAIDNYLGARKEKIGNITDLEDIWCRAIELARNHVPNRQVEIALEVSRRLVDVSRHETAADILFEIGRADEAIDVCVSGKKFEKAKQLSQGNESLRRRVDEEFQGHLVGAEDHSQLVGIGKTDVALDVLAKRGDWDRLWETATKEHVPPAAIAKFVLMRVDELVKTGRVDDLNEAVKTIHQRPGPATEVAMKVYKRLVRSVMSRTFDDERTKGGDTSEHTDLVCKLREVLYRLANQYRSNATGKQLGPEMEELLMATHYQHLLYHTKTLGLKDIAAKCSITLLKYPDVIPQDKAFYQAGITCRDQGNINLAFMLLNRYVDITEAIDSQDASFLDNADYHDTDAVPLQGPLPEKHYLVSEDSREEVRTWVLSVVTDSNIEQKFPPREQSRNSLYEGMFNSNRPTCIVTGFPVHPADILEVNNSCANRRDWNAFVGKARTCPWTGAAQNPLY